MKHNRLPSRHAHRVRPNRSEEHDNKNKNNKKNEKVNATASKEGESKL